MTQKDAARRLGVDQGTLAKWEQGKREPAGVFLARVRRFGRGEELDARQVGLGADPSTMNKPVLATPEGKAKCLNSGVIVCWLPSYTLRPLRSR